MPKLNLKYILEKFDFNLIGIYSLLGFLYYLLNLTLDSLFGIIFGSLIAFIFFVQLPDFKDKFDNLKEALLVVVSTITGFIFFGNIIFLSGITLGLAFTVFYLHFNTKYKLDITYSYIFNGIIILSIVLVSAIEKFRGFNKLTEMDVKLIGPLIAASILAYYFFITIVKTINKINHNSKDLKLLIATVLILGNVFFLISYLTFKEVGNYLIFGPLIGAIIVFSSEILKLNFKLDILNIIIFVFLIAYPYQVAGVLGISLAVLVSILLIKFLTKKDYQAYSIVYQMFFILYVFAASEYRENEGLIPKFNLVSGYQLVYLFIGTTLVLKFEYLIDTLRSLLETNELTNMNGFLGTLFTLVIIQTGLKYFGWDVIIGTIITGTIILSLHRGVKTEIVKPASVTSIMYLLNLLGAILLNISIKI